MKSEGQIKHKLAQVRFRHLKRELRNGLSRKSTNCQFNGTVDLPGRPCLGVCLYKAEDPAEWNGGTCDESLGDRAAQCPLFECLNTRELIKDEFESFLEKADRARIAERYPDMAALLWALDIEKAEGLPELEDDEATDHEQQLSDTSRALLKAGVEDVREGRVRELPASELAVEAPSTEPPESSLRVLAVYSPTDSELEAERESEPASLPVVRVGLVALMLQLWVHLTGLFRRG